MDALTQPFGKTSTKGRGRIDSAVRIVNVIAGLGKGNGRFVESLQNRPDARADQKVGDDYVSRASSGQSSACANEASKAYIGTKDSADSDTTGEDEVGKYVDLMGQWNCPWVVSTISMISPMPALRIC